MIKPVPPDIRLLAAAADVQAANVRLNQALGDLVGSPTDSTALARFTTEQRKTRRTLDVLWRERGSAHRPEPIEDPVAGGERAAAPCLAPPRDGADSRGAS